MKSQRIEWLDVLRGFAMLWMTGFHFSFDLQQAGYIQQNFYDDPVWTWQRTCILSLFLLCAGAGQALALHQGQSWRAFAKRCLQIAACAVLVTAGSLAMFPNSFIYFGVLHGMVAMLLIARLTAGWGRWLWPLGAFTIALKYVAAYAIYTWTSAEFLNEKWINWLGLISVKPITEDFVPLVPWLGVMWWGMASAQWWLTRAAVKADGTGNVKVAMSEKTQRRTSTQLPLVLRPLAKLGRWSLSYYMLHQPVLLAALWVWGGRCRTVASMIHLDIPI